MDEHTSHELAYKKGYEAGKPKWIPVTERLPEYGQIVLAFGKRHATSGMFRGTTSKPNQWHWKGNMYKEVSHWMPLPSPPSTEVQND